MATSIPSDRLKPVVSKNLNGAEKLGILEAFSKSAKTFCGRRARERRSASRPPLPGLPFPASWIAPNSYAASRR